MLVNDFSNQPLDDKAYINVDQVARGSFLDSMYVTVYKQERHTV